MTFVYATYGDAAAPGRLDATAMGIYQHIDNQQLPLRYMLLDDEIVASGVLERIPYDELMVPIDVYGCSGTIIHFLISTNKVKSVEALLRRFGFAAIVEASCAYGDRTILHSACSDWNSKCAELLLSPEHLEKHGDVIERILNKPDCGTFGNTPLHYACFSHSPKKIIELFIRAGADVLALNKLGQTPRDVLNAYSNRPDVDAVLQDAAAAAAAIIPR